MATSTLTSKGQITLPKSVREHLHLGKGDQVDFIAADDGKVVLQRLGTSVRALAGMLYRRGRKPLSLAEMDDAIAEAVGRKARKK